MRTPSVRRARLARRLGLDGNELRRVSDRIEVWFVFAIIVAFGPLAAVATSAVAGLVHDAGARELRTEQPLRQVTAVVLPRTTAVGASATGSAWSWEPARWTVNGVTRTGYVRGEPSMPPGTQVPIWIDGAGQVQPPPLTAAQVTARAVLAAVATPPAVAFGLWLAWRGLRWRLDRHRLARWGRAWSVVEPLWTRRPHGGGIGR